ncbi:MAG: TonB-dependent receptor [Bacteroidota bacterium]
MLKNIWFLAVILLLPWISMSQTQRENYNISGRITDASGFPLPFANVLIESLGKGATTDNNGQFLLKNIPSGNYTLTLQLLGYATQEKKITLTNSDVSGLEFKLQESSEQLEEVVVEGESKKSELERSAQAITVIETENVKLQTIELADVLANTEGVVVRRTGGLGSNTQFSLNGLQGEQVRFFLDGIPLNFLGFPNGIANVPVNLLERVEIYKGVVPIRFGADALGGAINLVSSSGILGTGAEASYQVGSFNTHRVTFNFRNQKEGKKFFTRGSGFYDFTNNNYKIDVEVDDERGRPVPVNAERFHDDYRAIGANLELGFTDITWANKLSFTAFYNEFDRDIQNNNFQSIPYGEATTDETVFGALLRWDQEWNKKWSSDINIGYSYNSVSLFDISNCRYNWLGECVFTGTSLGEIEDFPFDQEIWDNNYYARVLSEYELNSSSSFRFSLAPTQTIRSGENFRITDPDTPDPLAVEQRAFALVSGIEYEWTGIEDKLEFLTFVKNYQQNIRGESLGFAGEIIERDSDENIWGVGASLRFNLIKNVQVKASYERAARVPTAREVFGDGAQIRPNLDLSAERTNNANISFSYASGIDSKDDWSFGVNGFLRDTENLIQLLGFENLFVFRNVFSALSIGTELTARWSGFNNRLKISGNATWQDFRNTAEEGAFAVFNGDRIPNQPYLFANGSASYQFNELIKSGDDLTLFWGGRFINEFFRNWESIQAANRITIPSQFIQNLGITYRLPGKPYNWALTVESQNILDRDVFDNFGVQRPGRSLFFKLNINI